jgi:predicted dehydrogenase
VIDLARFLNGEITSVSGLVKTFLAGREVDDAIEAAVEFENGSVGTIDAFRTRPSQLAPVGDQRLEGIARVRHGAAQRAAGVPVADAATARAASRRCS